MSKLIVNEIEKYDAGQLTITTGTNVSIGSNLTVGGTIAGTLSTAAQTNITSVGTLSSLAVSGNLTVDTNTLYVDAANNFVGIGTTSPATQLNVLKDSADVEIRGSSTTSGNIRFGFDASGATYNWIQTDRSSGAMQFAVGNAERMRIDSSGNVGIGTSSPNTRLDVNGVINVRTNGYEFGRIKTNNADADSGGLTFQYNNNTVFTDGLILNHQGNVGIGGTPTEKLHIQGTNQNIFIDAGKLKIAYGSSGYRTDIYTEYSFPYVNSIIESVAGASYEGQILFKTSSNGGASTEKMRITNEGDVLVGTSTDFGGKVSIAGDNVSIVTRGATSTNSGTWTMQRADTGASTWRITTNQDNFFVADADFSHYAFLVQNPTGWSFGSDERLKQDIEDIDYGLDTILNLKPRRFTFKSSQKNTVGFIAQELKGIVPEAVTGEEKEISDTDTNEEIAKKILGVSNDTLIPILVKAIQELKAEIETLKSQING